MARLYGKSALVVGAGSSGPGVGNGKAAAILFAREGASVVCADIDRDAAEATAAIIRDEGGRATAVQADIADPAACAAMAQAAIDAHGRIDVLQNNVGVLKVGGAIDLAIEDWDAVHAVNQRGVFLVCKAVLPQMRAQGGGAIVNVSSIAAIRWTGVPFIAYAATKAAIVSMTQSIALEHARDGVRANCVLPGLMDTPMIRSGLPDAYAAGDIDAMVAARDAQCPTGKMGDAWDVAYASLFLASDEARYVTGQPLVVDGGITAKFA